NATLNVTSATGTEIRFTLTDTLDDSLFYFPLTVKIRVDSAWEAVAAVQNGSSVPVELVEHGGNSYALVQAVPDGGEVSLQKVVSEGLLVVVRGASHDRVWVDGGFSGTSVGSYAAPYKTVQAGLDAAVPGDTVSVREGVYRESIVLPSGTAAQPIALSAASGERVVLNAMVPLEDWQPMVGGFYSKLAAWEPAALYSGFRKMVLAREPNEGWWEAVSVGEDVPAGTLTITDAGNLAGLPYDLAGASVYLWTQGSDQFYTCPIVSFDPILGTVEFEKTSPTMVAAAGDKYWLQNQVSLVNQPDEWAADPEGADFRIYFAPEDTADLAGTQIPPASGWVVSGQNAAHVRLNNLEVAGGNGQGIYLLDAQDIEINRCIVHDNVLYGIWMDGAQDCSVQNSILINNRFGLACVGSSGIWVEGNEIGDNNEDGLLFAWGSSSMTARRNYIHNHMLWGHPDNSQTYRGVTGVQYIENLIISGGQSVMLEETADAEFSGNMVIGSAANMFSFGHGTVTNVVMHGNTLACS
ncbi:MAG: right-handed parallel beta-helix repeat-containing protein, partial [Verrucomicrobiota bacterium]|nr:right-handed parallel beta-helix repeat-containing protein [Verrucomicrobiota bacterium]